MKILRLGKNGMVRSQKGTWFNANHFIAFLIDNPEKKVWRLYGDTVSGDRYILGLFDTKEEAKSELDSLFGENEKGEKCT